MGWGKAQQCFLITGICPLLFPPPFSSSFLHFISSSTSFFLLLLSPQFLEQPSHMVIYNSTEARLQNKQNLLASICICVKECVCVLSRRIKVRKRCLLKCGFFYVCFGPSCSLFTLCFHVIFTLYCPCWDGNIYKTDPLMC